MTSHVHVCVFTNLTEIAPMRIPILLISSIFTTCIFDHSSAASAEIDPESGYIKMDGSKRASFPEHWGNPPARQTRDLVSLPGSYGRGSSTLRTWVLEKMADDEKREATSGAGSGLTGAADGTPWPERDLTGMDAEEARAAVLAGTLGIEGRNVHVLPQDAMVTMDFREDRVRIFVDGNNKVARQPMPG